MVPQKNRLKIEWYIIAKTGSYKCDTYVLCDTDLVTGCRGWMGYSVNHVGTYTGARLELHYEIGYWICTSEEMLRINAYSIELNSV